jgi:hypothetical protein
LFAEISPLDRKLVNRGRVCGFWWRLGLLPWPWLEWICSHSLRCKWDALG